MTLTLRLLTAAGACALVLAVQAVAEVTTLRQELSFEKLSGARGSAAINRCLEERIDRLPAGSTLRIDATSSLWYQRAAEAAFPRLEVVGAAVPTDYVISITTPATDPYCPGLDVVVTRVG